MASRRLFSRLSLVAVLCTACGEDAPPVTGTSGSNGVGGSAAGNGSGGASGSVGTSGSGGSSGNVGTSGSGGSSGNVGTSGSSGSGGVGGGQSGGAGGKGGTGGAGGSGMGGSVGGGGPGPIPLKNPPVKSAGCDKPTTLTSGQKTIMSSNRQRRYILDIPANYDMTKPYRFVYASHWIDAEASDVERQGYYHLKAKAQADNEPAIFLAPYAGDTGKGTWSSTNNVDHVFFDDLLKHVKENLCIDTTRVFAIGFSFGGMQTWSLSVNHQKDIRAAVGIAPANWNIYVPEKTHQPIAWMQTTGTGDNLCKWVNNDAEKEGAKYIALEHAADNGCTVPADIPQWQQGEFFCYDFEGCPASYPTKACTFNGGHVSTDAEPWIAEEAWKFFKQF